MAKELKKKRDEAKQAWQNATVVMKAKNADDFTGSKKAHDEAEKLRVDYLKAEKVSEADTDDSENTLAMSAHRWRYWHANHANHRFAFVSSTSIRAGTF